MVAMAQDEFVGRSLIKYGEFSPVQAKAVMHLIPPSGTALDVGANLGALSVPMSLKAGELYVFEPQGPLAVMCKINLALRAPEGCRCDIRQCAVGREAGTIKIPSLSYNMSANYGAFSKTTWEREYEHTEEIPVITIDSLGLERCDFIKIDVEGMELDVLEGAAETIRSLKPVLMVECDRPDTGPEVVRWLLEAGYDVRRFPTPLFVEDNFRKDPENIFGTTVSLDVLAWPPNIERPKIAGLSAASPDMDMQSCPMREIVYLSNE